MFVCLFVLYAFGHGTTKCNEILHRIPFRPGEGHRVVFDPKFSPQGGVYPGLPSVPHFGVQYPILTFCTSQKSVPLGYTFCTPF